MRYSFLLALLCILTALPALLSAAANEKEAFLAFEQDLMQTFDVLCQKSPQLKNTRALYQEAVSGFVRDFREKIFQKIPQDARTEWIAFQGSKACRELNQAILSGKISLKDGEAQIQKLLPKYTQATRALTPVLRELQKDLTKNYLSALQKQILQEALQK